MILLLLTYFNQLKLPLVAQKLILKNTKWFFIAPFVKKSIQRRDIIEKVCSQGIIPSLENMEFNESMLIFKFAAKYENYDLFKCYYEYICLISSNDPYVLYKISRIATHTANEMFLEFTANTSEEDFRKLYKNQDENTIIKLVNLRDFSRQSIHTRYCFKYNKPWVIFHILRWGGLSAQGWRYLLHAAIEYNNQNYIDIAIQCVNITKIAFYFACRGGNLRFIKEYCSHFSIKHSYFSVACRRGHLPVVLYLEPFVSKRCIYKGIKAACKKPRINIIEHYLKSGFVLNDNLTDVLKKNGYKLLN